MMLFERDAHLAALNLRLEEAAAGRGGLVFLSGEAGAGKTSLVEAFAQQVPSGTPISIVSCDGLGMPGPFGPLFDIAEALGPQVQAVLSEPAPQDQIFRAVLSALRSAPQANVLVAEDAHWSDEASLNLLRFLGRRAATTRTLLIVTYREDDIDPYHPIRRVLGDLVNEPAVSRMWVPPLSIGAVRSLAAGSSLDPIELHERTGGNPFYVTEIIAGGGNDVPPTIRDAVLGRASRVGIDGRAVVEAASAIGAVVEPDVLSRVVGVSVDDALDECLSAGILRLSGDDVIFRHALTRDVLLASMSPSRRRGLHRRILDVLIADPERSCEWPRLAHHAEECRDAEAVLRFAPAAAKQAAQYGAHREAAAQYARALRFSSGLDGQPLAELLEARAYECYLAGLHEDAITEQTRAVAIREKLGNPLAYGDGLRRLSRFNWFTGRNQESERYAELALDTLEPLPPGPELAMAYSNLSQLRMLSKQSREAIRWGERAIDLAQQLDAKPVLVHAMTNVGTAHLSLENDQAFAMLEESIRIARQEGLHDDVSRALANLACEYLDRCDQVNAERYITEGIEFTAEHDLIGMERYLRARRAQLALEQGDWETVEQDAVAASDHPGAVAPTKIVANTLIGLVRARQGADPWPALDEALELAERTGELQRLGPVRIARAEAAWLSGDLERTSVEAHQVYEAALGEGLRWMAGSLALWLHRSGHSVAGDTPLAEPFALEIAGEGRSAAAIWRERGYPIEEARALESAQNEGSLREALAIFDRLGAKPDAARTIRALRNTGARQIPRGPRPGTRANAAGLTARELEVLHLLTLGRSNKEIAGELFLSARTVGHHVSAILAKLDISSRAEAHTRAEALHLLPDRSSSIPN